MLYFIQENKGSSGEIGESWQQKILAQPKVLKAAKYFVYFPLLKPHSWGKRSAAQPKTIDSYYFSIKWLTPFYPANPSQVAGSGEKCMDLRFLRLRRRLLKQQPNKTVFNRFIKATPHNCVCESQPSFCPTSSV